MRNGQALGYRASLIVMAALGAAGMAAAPAAANPAHSTASGASGASGIGQAIPIVTPPTFPQEFAAVPQPATLPINEASACPVPASPGQVQCMAIARTGLPSLVGVQTAAAVPGLSPANLQSAYALTSASATGGTSNGTPETVATVVAYNDPNAATDLATYRAQWGLPACNATTGAGCVTIVNQANQVSPLPPSPPASAGDWTWEASADLDTVSAICPNCHILLVEANNAEVKNLGQAELAARNDANFIANNWGSPEFFGESSSDILYFDSPGKAIVFAAGDSGYGTAWPAASQFVTAVGGTTLTSDSAVTRGWAETAWSGTGSGCAIAEAKPSWQTADNSSPAGCLNRTANDVAAVADPSTGAAVYDSTASGSRAAGWGVAGGTSVAASVVTSVYALAGTPQTGTYPASYAYQSGHAASLFSVTGGSNGSCETNRAYLCTAQPGYNGPAGLGSPDGTAGFANSATGDLVTVTDPGTQDDQAGSAVKLPVDATDSATGPTLTYTATGLPGGLTIDAKTGLISGTLSTTTGTSNVTVTASDGTGSGSVRFRMVVLPSLRTGYHPVSGPVHLNLGGLCLDDTGGSTADHNKIQIYGCNGLASQNWTYQPDGSPGGAGTLTFNGRCADLIGYGTTNGTKVQLYTCNGGTNQQWAIASDATLVNPISARCLNDPGGSTTGGTQVDIADCSGARYQQWTLPASPVQSGVSGQCVDDTSGSNADGNKIQIYGCNGLVTQKWTPQPDATVRIAGKCLDVKDLSKLDGGLIQLWNCLGGRNQKWIIGPQGQLENVNSGRCLTDPGNTTVAGTQLTQEDCYGEPGQVWATT